MRHHEVSRPRPRADSRRFVRPVVAAAMLATLVSAIAVLSLPVAPPASAAFDGGTDLFISVERAISDNVGSPSDCTTSQIAADATARTDVDAQNDPWIATAASRGLGLVLPAVIPVPADPDRVDVSPTELSVPGSSVTIGVSYRNVPHSQIAAYNSAAVGDPSVGTDPNAGGGSTAYRNPYTPIPADGTMQDCSPYPASLYDTSSAPGIQPARQWNALFGSGTDLDGALFEFSSPVAAFGAWFGDLETRPPATPAYLKLLDAAGTVVWEGPVPATVAASPTDAECGGPNASTDLLGCGNQTTRWIGFVTKPGDPLISKMLVVVGDDDSCAQTTPSQCDGSTEHFSWVGAMVAEEDPATTTTTVPPTSTTTSTSSTTTTTTTTAVPPTTSTTSTTTAVPPTSTTAKPLVSPTTSFLAYTGNTELVPFALGLLVLGGALRMLAKRSK